MAIESISTAIRFAAVAPACLIAPISSAPWPVFGEEEVAAAARVLRSGRVNYWTGQEGRLFEEEFAQIAGCRYAVAVANGTVALELALRAVGIGSGDEVVVPSRTFFATASSVVAVGARPVFADVDRNSQNLTANTIRAVLTPRVRAIIAVHLAGWPCDMDSILALAHEFNIKLVEDCAQAHGSTYKGAPVGSFGYAAAFSFCQDKIVTTAGEGGMVTTNSQELWKAMWSYKDHGKSHDAVFMRDHAPGFRWLHESFGTNWRLSEVQSAVGRVGLRKLPGWLASRHSNASILTDRLSAIRGLRVPVVPEYIKRACYKQYVFTVPDELSDGWDRDRIAAAISAHGVPCSTGSCSEIYMEQAVPIEWRPPARHAVARELGSTSLMFMVHPTLTHEHMDHTCRVVEHVMAVASRT
ncbi:MAG TPA: DegT/DnrJ/EryC1/StrS aminotransferase family protein [Acidisarcina sp.]